MREATTEELLERIKELEENEQVLNDAHCKLMGKLEATQTKWISVKDSLPDELDDVAVLDARTGFKFVCHLEINEAITNDTKPERWWTDNDYCFEFGEFTHWMPLPPPPTTATEKEDK